MTIGDDFKFLSHSIVDMETAKQKLAMSIGKNGTYSLQDIGDASMGTGTDNGILLFSSQYNR